MPWKRGKSKNNVLTILCPNLFRNESIPYNPIWQENWKNKFRESFPYNILISSLGTIIPEVQYKDICYELNYMRIAMNIDPDIFEMQNITGFYDFVRYPLQIVTGYAYISWDYEVLDPFFEHYNIIPIFSDMNFTWGWLDNETNLWTGGIGAVK